MRVPKSLYEQLLKMEINLTEQTTIAGSIFLGYAMEMRGFFSCFLNPLTSFEDLNVSSFTVANPGFYKNVSVGTYCSMAEGVKIVPQYNLTGLTTANLDSVNQGLGDHIPSPVFANFKRCQAPHAANTERQPACSYPHTLIGHDVWLGSNVQIQAGTIIGHGAVVGANTLVTKHVPPYAIVVGNPARFLRMRFTPEQIERIRNSAWYQYDWQTINLPWNTFDATMQAMEQHIAQNSARKIGEGILLTVDGDNIKQQTHVWTFEDQMQRMFGTQDMYELFTRPEILAQSYSLE